MRPDVTKVGLSLVVDYRFKKGDLFCIEHLITDFWGVSESCKHLKDKLYMEKFISRNFHNDRLMLPSGRSRPLVCRPWMCCHMTRKMVEASLSAVADRDDGSTSGIGKNDNDWVCCSWR